MNVKKSDYLFTFLIGVLIAIGILTVSYAKEPYYQLPTGNTYAVSEVREIEIREINIRNEEEKPRANPIVNKQPVIISDKWDWQNEEGNEKPVQSVLRHNWYTETDYRQDIVNYAYELGWMDLVTLIDCESGTNPKANWDGWHARWLCQISDFYHKIPQQYFDDWRFQVEYCAEKRKWGTKFYWPQRIIKWQQCSKYVLSRFTFL